MTNEVKQTKHKSGKINRNSRRIVLDRRKRSHDKSDPSDSDSEVSSLASIIRGAHDQGVGRQLGGIAGVDYDTIYLSIGKRFPSFE